MKVDRRRQIIEAASQSFVLFGYKATTMEHVARIGNVGKGTIYTYFKNKEELFEEIMRSVMTEMEFIAKQAFEPTRNWFDNLLQLLNDIIEFNKHNPLLNQLMQEERRIGTLAVREGIRLLENNMIKLIQLELDKALARQAIKPCDPKLTAFVMLKLYKAIMYEWNEDLEYGSLDKEDLAKLFRLYLVDGIALS